MARRRLTLPDPAQLAGAGGSTGGGTGKLPAAEARAMFPLGAARPAPVSSAPATPPIARVAGEAAATAALADLSDAVARARDEGRMIQALPLEAVDEAYLVRDRIGTDEEALASLMQSIEARGQQVPIEVVALGADAAGRARYGLITGWRRLTALRRLSAAGPAGSRFASVQAVLRRPETAAEAYLAMVEENEIRVGLSYYERARIVARAAEQGVFPDPATALSRLFAAASRPKRSKIGSFLRIHAALDDRLRFAAAIPERLGLALVKALDADPGFAEGLRERLRQAPPASAAEEIETLTAALRRPVNPNRVAAPPETEQIRSGLRLSTTPGRLVLEGPEVTAALRARLLSWLRDTGPRDAR